MVNLEQEKILKIVLNFTFCFVSSLRRQGQRLLLVKESLIAERSIFDENTFHRRAAARPLIKDFLRSLKLFLSSTIVSTDFVTPLTCNAVETIPPRI